MFAVREAFGCHQLWKSEAYIQGCRGWGSTAASSEKKVILLSVAAFPFQFFAKKKRYLQNFAKIQLRFVGVSIERCEAHNGVTGEISSTKQKSHKTSSGGFYKNYENDRLFTLFAVKNSCNILLFDNVFKYTIYSSIQA